MPNKCSGQNCNQVVFWPHAIPKSHSMDSTRKHNLTTTNRSITSNTMDTKDSLGRRKKNVIKPNWPKNKVNKLKKNNKKNQNKSSIPPHLVPSTYPRHCPTLPCPSLKGEMCPEVNCSTGDCPVKPFLRWKFPGGNFQQPGTEGFVNWGKIVGIYPPVLEEVDFWFKLF